MEIAPNGARRESLVSANEAASSVAALPTTVSGNVGAVNAAPATPERLNRAAPTVLPFPTLTPFALSDAPVSNQLLNISNVASNQENVAAIASLGRGTPTEIPNAAAPACNVEEVTQREAAFQALVQQRDANPGSVSDDTFQAAAQAYLDSTEGCYVNRRQTPIDEDGQWMPGFGSSADYVLFGTKWGGNSPYNPNSPPGTGGGTVTYSFMPNGVNMSAEGASASTAVSSLPTYQACFLTEIQTAFAAWSAVADVDFVQVADNGAAFNASGAAGDIRIGAHPFDGPSGTLAHAYYPPPNGNTAAGDLHYDSGENWTCNTSGIDIGIVTVHEIGHSLGLDHSQFTSAIMYPFYNPSLNSPQSDDISGVQLIYGSGVPTPTPTDPPPCPTFPYTVPAGNVDLLNNAVKCANDNGTSHDVINLTNSTYTLVAAVGVTSMPAITTPITIHGNNAIIERSQAAGTPNFSVLRVVNNGNLTLDDVTLRNGNTPSPGTGAGMQLLDGTATLTNVTFFNNSAQESSGAGIYARNSTLTIIDSTFTNNIALQGTGVYFDSGTMNVSNSLFADNLASGVGGALANTNGTMTVTNTTFSDNQAGTGGGALWTDGTTTIIGSTFVNNSANVGGAISNGDDTTTIRNSTFTDNSSEWGGAICGCGESATTIVTNSTIVGNSVSGSTPRGGGIMNFINGNGISGVVKIGSIIISDNVGAFGTNLYGPITSLGWNVINNTAGATITGATSSDIVNAAASPLTVYPLANNGGPTETMELGAGSIAIAHGNCSTLSGIAPVTTDQRGEARHPYPCDVGAYEKPRTAPNISNIVDQTTSEDVKTPLIPFTISDPNTPLSVLTITGESSDQTKVPNANIVITGTGANRKVRITPAANQFGTVTITLTVSDETESATDTFVLTVNAVNDAPTITNIGNLSTYRNVPVTIPFTIGDVDNTVGSLTLSKSSSSQARVPNANIVFSGSGTNRSVMITPALNQTGNALITLCVTDGTTTTCDDFMLSIVLPPDPIFSDGFESYNLNAWSASVTDGGDLNANSVALMGNYALQALIDDATPIYLTDETPNDERSYRARFLFDPHYITMANNDNFVVFNAYQAPSVQMMQLQFRRSSGSYQLRVGTLLDDGTTWLYTPYATLSNESHLVEIAWQAATSDGANDGNLTLWVDEAQQTPLTGLNNDTRRIDRVRLGAVAGIDAGTSGMIFFDAFVSRRLTYIGYIIPTPALVSPGNGTLIARENPPTFTWNSAAGATQYFAQLSDGTTVINDSNWTNSTSWSPGALAQGTYTWRVKARDGGGEESAWSAPRTLTIRPGKPTNLQGSAVGATQVALTWTASIDAPGGITGYVIYREGVQIGTSGGSTPSFSDNAAVDCAANHYKVTAVNGAVASAESNEITVNTFCELIFRDGFENALLNRWTASATDGSDLSVNGDASLMGAYGMQAVINDATPIYVQDDSPNAEARYRARFLFDPNAITMASIDNFLVFIGYQGASTQVLQLQFRRSGSSYQVRAGALDDGVTWFYTPYATFNDARHSIELDWQAATSAGANNGSLTLWVDEVQQTPVTGIDNDTRRIDRARLGAVAGIDAGTNGALYFDAFISRRTTYIGLSLAAPSLISPADGASIARDQDVNLDWDAVPGATVYYAEFSNGTSVNLFSGWTISEGWALGYQPVGVYTWRVRAGNDNGEGSAWSETRTLYVAPLPPLDVQGTAPVSGQVHLTWILSPDGSSSIDEYRIYRDGVQIGTENSTTASFVDATAADCTAYQYSVRSFRNGVESLNSNAAAVNSFCDTLFSDGFESGSLSVWSAHLSDGGDLSVTTDAHLTTSTYGMQAVIDDINSIHVTDDSPNAELRYRARFYFDPNTVTMANGTSFPIFYGIQDASTVVFQIQMRRNSGSYQIRVGVRDDASTYTYSTFYNITDDPHMLEIDWQAATADGANNGSLALWIDEALKQTLMGVNNDTRHIDRARLGLVGAIDAGTSGTIYFDAFVSRRLTYIGAEVGGLGVIVEPEPTEMPPVEPTVEPTETPTIEPTLPPVEPTIEPTLLPFSVPVFQTMDDGAPLWTASTGWQLSADAAYSGLGWQAAASGHVETLALKVPVNLAGTAAPTLSFQSKLISGVLPEVRVSVDGVNWQVVASVTPSLNWAVVTVDLTAYAGQTVLVQFTWSAPAGTSDRWMLDALVIADGAPPSEPTEPAIEPSATVTPDVPGNEPPVYIPTPQPREGGGSQPDAPADLPSAPIG